LLFALSNSLVIEYFDNELKQIFINVYFKRIFNCYEAWYTVFWICYLCVVLITLLSVCVGISVKSEISQEHVIGDVLNCALLQYFSLTVWYFFQWFVQLFNIGMHCSSVVLLKLLCCCCSVNFCIYVVLFWIWL